MRTPGNEISSRKKNGGKKDKKKIDLGDLLGRSKDGFTRLNTHDDDEEANGGNGSLLNTNFSSDDSDLEDFSVPALNT